MFLFPYESVNVELSISKETFPLHSLKLFPLWNPACSKFDNVIVCITSFAPVVVFVPCVAVPTSILILFVAFSPSINTFTLFFSNDVVTSLVYSFDNTSGFVVPLNVIFIVFSVVFTSTFSFVHSVLYFGFIVPVVSSIVVVEFVFALKCVVSLNIASGA